jgi:Domain of Unknown Function (DUF1080)
VEADARLKRRNHSKDCGSGSIQRPTFFLIFWTRTNIATIFNLNPNDRKIMQHYANFLVIFAVFALASPLSPTLADNDSDGNNVWYPLLDRNLSQWEVFMGVPHPSVDVDWPSKSESGTIGQPMGLNNDPLKVFSVKEMEGETVLCITGQIYGGLTTLKEYENYHLSLQFKWGDKKWPPRNNQKRDSGLLVHCVGKHGAFWNVWMRSLECQIQDCT